MSWTLGIGVYFVIWWTFLTAVLPWGIRSQAEAGDIVPGSERSAPVKPQMWKRIVANTILAAVIWLLADLAYFYFYLGRWPSF